MSKRGKNPKAGAYIAPTQKVPRGGALADVSAKNFCWRVTEIDFDGPFGWHRADVYQVLGEIVPKLHDYESMKWGDMDGASGSHSVELENLCADAQARLQAIGKDEQGRLYSVRITGERRVWGIRDIGILRVLWWDPDHAVCPSHKKHT
jgi:hypothetical protein